MQHYHTSFLSRRIDAALDDERMVKNACNLIYDRGKGTEVLQA